MNAEQFNEKLHSISSRLNAAAERAKAREQQLHMLAVDAYDTFEGFDAEAALSALADDLTRDRVELQAVARELEQLWVRSPKAEGVAEQ